MAMTTKNLINTIYNYYPQDIDWYNIKANTDSFEYKNRKKKCLEAANDNKSWADLKKDLTSFNTSENNSRVYDYSMLGSVPCYHGSMSFGILGSNIISVFISVIVPLWAYRIMDADGLLPPRYRYINEEETDCYEVGIIGQ